MNFVYKTFFLLALKDQIKHPKGKEVTLHTPHQIQLFNIKELKRKRVNIDSVFNNNKKIIK